MFTMFREDSKEAGKAGPVSMRRVLAFLLAVASIGLLVAGILVVEKGWFVFIGGTIPLAGALLLLFFTTWGDIAKVANAVRK